MSINQNVVTTSIVQLVQNLEENISKILIKNQNASRNHKQIISKVSDFSAPGTPRRSRALLYENPVDVNMTTTTVF